MSNFSLMLLICLGMIGFVVVGSYAFDANDQGPRLVCASSTGDGDSARSCTTR